MSDAADPLTVYCRHCGASAGQPCERFVSWGPSPRPPARKPHAVRVRDAESAVAAQQEDDHA